MEKIQNNDVLYLLHKKPLLLILINVLQLHTRMLKEETLANYRNYFNKFKFNLYSLALFIRKRGKV